MIELHGWLSIVETYKNEDFIQQEEIEKIGKRKQGYLRRIGKIDSRKSKKLIKK